MTKALFKNAQIMSANEEIGNLEEADILVVDSRIDQVGANLSDPDAEVFDAKGMLIMPGMADTHTHLWQTIFKGRAADAWGMEYFTNIPPMSQHFTADDVYAAIYAGCVESMANGVTNIFDYHTCIHSPEFADATVQAFKDSGIRATFGYDLGAFSLGESDKIGPSEARFPDVERLRGEIPNGKEDLLRLGVCLSQILPEKIDRMEREINFAREVDVPMTWHNNKPGEIEAINRSGLLDTDILPAHSNYTTDEDLRLLAEIGGCLTSQTEAETYAGRRSMSMIKRAFDLGVDLAIGTDVPNIISMGVMPQMRALYILQRVLDGINERYEGHYPVTRRPGVPTFSPRDIVEIATSNGGKAMGIGDVVGQIAPGYQADLVLFDGRDFGISEGDPAGHVVLNSSAGEIDSVMVAGEFRKRDGKMVGIETGKVVKLREAARDRVYASVGTRPGELKRTYWNWAED